MNKGNRLAIAFHKLMIELFGMLPEQLHEREVSRSTYTNALRKVEAECDIKQGDEDYLEWVLTLVGRSPKIVEDEGSNHDASRATEDGQ